MKINQLSQIVTPLSEWYQTNKRDLPWRKTIDPYRIWVSEIMLQQTRVDTVIPYYERFMEHCPSIPALATCKDEKLLKLWEGLGYYSRARNLKKAAQIIYTEYEGCFPTQYQDILALPGIGVYTAGAISSIAFEQARAAVDGNVMRVITRLTENSHDITDAAFRKQITEELEAVYPSCHRGNFTQSLMELGAVICIPNGLPKCTDCPLRLLCGACIHGTQQQYPVKKQKAARKHEELMVLVLQCQDKIAVRKRKQKGVLSGMWELPNWNGHFKDTQIWERLTEINPLLNQCQNRICKREQLKHIFTHIEWHMDCLLIACDAEYELDGVIWVTRKELSDKIPLPTAFRKVYEKMM